MAANTGVDFKVRLMNQQEKREKLVIWDAPGQERFRSLLGGHNIYRGAKGVILVYDMSSRESFAKVEDWLTELETYSTNHDLIKMLVRQEVTFLLQFIFNCPGGK